METQTDVGIAQGSPVTEEVLATLRKIPGEITMPAVLELMREHAFEVIPSTMVCGWAGISEGAFRPRLKRMRPAYVHVGTRAIQVVPLADALAEFFPDGLDQEAQEELDLGRANDCFMFLNGEPMRLLHAGMVKPDVARRAAMRHTYKHGKRGK